MKRNTTKRITTLLCALLLTLTAAADEGMWLPSLIGPRIKDMKAKGFRLTADDIYSVNKASMKDAVVLFGGFCTGELVSAEGLLLTNHHCGYDAIQSHSSVEHDYLTYGFWARNRAEELPNPGLWVRILIRMEEVTDRLQAGETPESILEAARAEGKNYRASIEQMYYGNQQYLFVYQQFDDVRLVGAPPSSIGKFGGDTDNWIWPRHTGDFSVFRVYADQNNEPAKYSADNVPYRPRRHFKVSDKGVGEGDFTMIYGFPGTTQEYIISDAVEYVEKVSDPMKIDLRTRRLDIISAAQEADLATRIQYAAKHASIANAWKKWQGEVLGLKRRHVAESKRDYERRFTEWAADKPQYAHLLDSMRAAYTVVTETYRRAELLNETVRTIELGQLAALNSTRAAKPAQWEAAAADRYRDFNVEVDRRLALCVLNGLKEYDRLPDDVQAEVDAHGGTVEAYVEWLYANSPSTSLERARNASAEQIEADPALKLRRMVAVNAGRGGIYAPIKRNLSNHPAVERWYRPWMRALMEFDPERPFYPDANMTLRVSYGKVAGYEYADGDWHLPNTTLDGIIAKDNPAIYDYDIPQQLRDLYASKDYGRWAVEVNGRRTVPVCFLATNHTTGGNSGSPVLNAKGELVGLNFDRTWTSTMSDIDYDPDICRNIAVDIRYVLFVIDRIGGAGYLIEEMGL